MNSEMNIECPSCGCEVPVTEVLQSQLTNDIRQEMQATLANQRAKLADREAAIKSAEQSLKKSNDDFQAKLDFAVAAEKANLSKAMLVKARETVKVELADKSQEVAELQKRVQQSESNELELRKRERELKVKNEKFEVELERKLELKLTKAKAEAVQASAEKYDLKAAEKDKTISDMKKKIDELQRKSEQTSQQLKGEVQEIALEDRLRQAFPIDSIDPVGKGKNGADAGQTVCDAIGQPAGKIIWESKRTVSFDKKWLPKIREDKRQANADIAVIVTKTMPANVETIGIVKGVWICRWDCVIGLASALRNGLINVAAAHKAQDGKETKVEMLYDYFAGSNFSNRISGMVEAIDTLKIDLAKEKTLTQRRWAKQEMGFDKAIANMAGLYGDFQGIIGDQVVAIENLEPLMLESEDAAAEPGDQKGDKAA